MRGRARREPLDARPARRAGETDHQFQKEIDDQKLAMIKERTAFLSQQLIPH
jgi:hypothetical protein